MLYKIGEIPLIGKGVDCKSIRYMPTTGSSPVLFIKSISHIDGKNIF